MRNQISIKYDGAAPGIAENRLDLGTFARALWELTKAFEETAKDFALGAFEDPEKAEMFARCVKLQLEDVKPGSFQGCYAIGFDGYSGDLDKLGLSGDELADWEDLFAEQFAKDLENAHTGEYVKSEMVAYHNSIPDAVSHDYALMRDGNVVFSYQLEGKAAEPPEPEAQAAEEPEKSVVFMTMYAVVIRDNSKFDKDKFKVTLKPIALRDGKHIKVKETIKCKCSRFVRDRAQNFVDDIGIAQVRIHNGKYKLMDMISVETYFQRLRGGQGESIDQDDEFFDRLIASLKPANEDVGADLFAKTYEDAQ